MFVRELSLLLLLFGCEVVTFRVAVSVHVIDSDSGGSVNNGSNDYDLANDDSYFI